MSTATVAGAIADQDDALRLLKVPAVAERLDCSRTHVYRLIAAGRLRAVEIKATGQRPKTRVRSDDLHAFIEASTTAA